MCQDKENNCFASKCPIPLNSKCVFYTDINLTALGVISGDNFQIILQKINTALNNKQSTLVSGTNIKTINGNSILGNGNLEIPGSNTGISGNYTPIATSLENISGFGEIYGTYMKIGNIVICTVTAILNVIAPGQVQFYFSTPVSNIGSNGNGTGMFFPIGSTIFGNLFTFTNGAHQGVRFMATFSGNHRLTTTFQYSIV